MPDGANAYPAYRLQRELFCVFVFARVGPVSVSATGQLS
ncbi:hypothetical protein SA26_3845 [Salmonella enterica subsp. enterica serovar Agona str. 26.F.98]|nr:hypothetical protein SA26_3845 [Salmonella enterica subsp. enterica serovar Agona str. 26.F.98]